ncbi:MAG: FGGY family carbohydrate kinase [Haliea sp.]
MGAFILAIDQGTTGTTVALMDDRGQLRTSVNLEFPQHYPQPGWVEHEARDIWHTVQRGIRAVLRKRLCKPGDIAAIGITNQRETALLWDRGSGEPLNRAIVWQCRRTTEFCETLKSAGHEKLVKRKSGLVLDPYFSASKFRWLLKNTPGIARKLKAGQVAAGTVDSYLFA